MTDTTPEQAIQESARCDACETYFKPRPQLDTGPFNRVFEAGFDFGYKYLADQVDRLTAELGDLPESQADMLREIKALKAERDALTKVIRSVKQEAETALVIGDEIGLRDGAEQILKECDEAISKGKL